MLLVIYLVNGLVMIPQNSVTYDEMDHWSYGKRILKVQPQKIYPFDDASAMPVSGLNAIPRAIQQLINPELRKTDAGFSDIMNGRYITLFICLLIGLLAYHWSRDMFGDKAGLFTLFLTVFSPNLIAHGTLLTTDAYAALFTLAPLYAFWRFVKEKTRMRFLVFAIAIASAQLVKPSLVHLFPLIGIIAVFLKTRSGHFFENWKKNFVRLLVLLSITILVINMGFFFVGTGQGWMDYDWQSAFFQNINIGFLKEIPIPLPFPYLQGLDMTFYMNELGAGHPQVSGPNYLLGETRSGDGFWYYYFVCFFFKTPLFTLSLFMILPLLLVRHRKDIPDSGLILLTTVFPVLYFLLVFGLSNRSQVGIRHVLMVYPLIFVALGIWYRLLSRIKPGQYILVLGILWSVYGFYRYYPNLIAFHNELISSRKVHRVMAGSNIDFGQSQFRVNDFLRKNPEYRIPDSVARAGKYIQGVDAYLGLMKDYDFRWLHQNFKPVDHFDHSFLLFEVSEEDLVKKGLK